jgi:hypothetical protein
MSFAHNRPRKTRLGAAAVLACIAIAAAGCGGAHRTGATQSAPPQNPAAAWHQVVLCARANGMPGLQDPRIDASGKAIFPNGLNVPAQTRRACQSLFDRLVPNAQNQAPTTAQLSALLQFARCMRSHGIPDWPDPRPDGTFIPDARISHSLKSAFRSQLMTCDHFNPDPRGRVYFGHP